MREDPLDQEEVPANPDGSAVHGLGVLPEELVEEEAELVEYLVSVLLQLSVEEE